ncbi:unnamed protein product [Dibothriocephalus latus]|uniref:Cytochrome b561 domain-containing protein n=1 Tax=Dibothriocephalus latus TaxID=60516 RepID=A0A3P7PC70_DIBLA|nr:unnamed protein product [Dibothriocephalus latus]
MAKHRHHSRMQGIGVAQSVCAGMLTIESTDTWLIGFISFLMPRISARIRATVLPTHTSLGVIIFVFAIASVCTGITEKNFFAGE